MATGAPGDSSDRGGPSTGGRGTAPCVPSVADAAGRGYPAGMPRTRPPLPPVQAAAPPGLPKRVTVLPLRLEDIRPVIRIAHRQPGSLRIAERIIFDHEVVLITRGVGEVVERRAEGLVRHPFAPRTLYCI